MCATSQQPCENIVIPLTKFSILEEATYISLVNQTKLMGEERRGEEGGLRKKTKVEHKKYGCEFQRGILV